MRTPHWDCTPPPEAATPPRSSSASTTTSTSTPGTVWPSTGFAVSIRYWALREPGSTDIFRLASGRTTTASSGAPAQPGTNGPGRPSPGLTDNATPPQCCTKRWSTPRRIPARFSVASTSTSTRYSPPTSVNGTSAGDLVPAGSGFHEINSTGSAFVRRYHLFGNLASPIEVVQGEDRPQPGGQRLLVDIRESLSGTNLELLYTGCPHRLIEPEPQNQRRHTGAHHRCGGARAAVVNGRLAAGKDRGVTDRVDKLDVVVVIEFGHVVGPGTDQQPLVQLRTRRHDHLDDLGGRRNRRTAHAEINGRSSLANPRQHLIVGIGRRLQGERADERLARFGPFVRLARQAPFVVGLDLHQRRRGLRPRGPGQRPTQRFLGRLDQPGVELSGRLKPRRKGVQRNQRNTFMFSDVRGEPLLVHARHKQVGVFSERCERRALVHPNLGDTLHDLGQRGVGVFHVGDEKIRRRVQLRLGVGPIGHRIETDRLGERDHVGRNRYAHVVASAPQLATDDGARLAITPTPIRGQNNFHRRKPH